MSIITSRNRRNPGGARPGSSRADSAADGTGTGTGTETLESSPADGSAAFAVGLLASRLGLVAVATVTTWLMLAAAGFTVPFPPGPLFATVALLPVNIVSLVLVRRLVHRSGGTVRALLGFERSRFGRDVLWGLLWLAVLYLPFVVTVMAVMWALHGPVMFERFETVFFDPSAVPGLPAAVLAVLAVVAVVSFAPLNAPAEELVYRGYAQRGLATRLPVSVAITISAVAFGLQHAFFAPTLDAAIVYVCAFTVWGAVSGVIVNRQGRLMPVVVAHFLVNLIMTAPALVFVFLPDLIGAS